MLNITKIAFSYNANIKYDGNMIIENFVVTILMKKMRSMIEIED